MKGAPTIQGRRRARIVRGDSLPRVRKSTLSRINESSLSLLTCVGICGEGALDGRNCESTCEAAVKGTSLAIVFRAWSGTSTARHQAPKSIKTPQRGFSFLSAWLCGSSSVWIERNTLGAADILRLLLSCPPQSGKRHPNKTRAPTVNKCVHAV